MNNVAEWLFETEKKPIKEIKMGKEFKEFSPLIETKNAYFENLVKNPC